MQIFRWSDEPPWLIEHDGGLVGDVVRGPDSCWMIEAKGDTLLPFTGRRFPSLADLLAALEGEGLAVTMAGRSRSE